MFVEGTEVDDGEGRAWWRSMARPLETVKPKKEGWSCSSPPAASSLMPGLDFASGVRMYGVGLIEVCDETNFRIDKA